MGTLASLMVQLGLNTSAFSTGLAKAKAETKSFGDTTNSSLASASSSHSKLGAIAGAAGKVVTGALLGGATGAIAVGVASMKLASDFDNAMRQVQTQGGITSSQMEGLRDGVLKISSATGTAATTLAGALMPIAAEGYKGADALNVLNTAAIGAKTYNTDLATTTTALTTVMKDYNFKATDSMHVMDLLGTAVANGRTSFQDMAGSISTVAPEAAALGVNVNGLLGNLVSMTSQGISADKATTALKFTLTSLVKPTSTATSALSGMHLTTKDLYTALSSGPQGLSTAFNMIVTAAGKEFPNAKDKQTAAIADIVGGARGLSAVLATTGAHLNATKAATDALSGASSGAGYTMSNWADVQKDFSTKTDQLKTTVQNVGIQIGSFLLPIFGQAVDWLKVKLPLAVATIQKWFVDHQKVLHQIWDTIKTYLLVVWKDLQKAFDVFKSVLSWSVDHWNLLKPILIAVGLAIVSLLGAMKVQAVWQFVSAFIAFAAEEGVAAAAAATLGISLDASLGPMLLIAAAIAAIIAIGYILITHWNTVKKIAGDVFGFIKNIVSDVWNWIKSNWPLLLAILLGPFGIVLDLIIKNFGPIKGFFSGLISDIAGIWGGLSGAIGGAVTTAINFVIGLLNDGIDLINGILGDIPMQGHFGIPSIPKIPHIPLIGGGASPPTSSGIKSVGTSSLPTVKMHSGGIVPGTPGQEVLGILLAGERVIASNPRGVAQAGSSAINSGQRGVADTGGMNLTIHAQGPNLTPKAIANEIAWTMRTQGKR